MTFFFCFFIIIVYSDVGQFRWIAPSDTSRDCEDATPWTGDPPCNRCCGGHLQSFYYEGSYVMFGGNSINVYYNDVWVVRMNSPPDYARLTDQAENYVGQGGFSPDAFPMARSHFGMARSTRTGSHFYMYGGMNQNSEYMCDLWLFDEETVEWAWLQGSESCFLINVNYAQRGIPHWGNAVGRRVSNYLVMMGDRIYFVMGGTKESSDAGGSANDVFSIHMDMENDYIWESGGNVLNVFGSYVQAGVYDQNSIPGARTHFSAWKINEEEFMIFGGLVYQDCGESSFPMEGNDLWTFNTGLRQWKFNSGDLVSPCLGVVIGTMGEYTFGNKPPGKRGALSIVLNEEKVDEVILYGGYGYVLVDSKEVFYQQDLWRYSVLLDKWGLFNDQLNRIVPQNYGSINIYDPDNISPGRADMVGGLYGIELFIFGGLANFSGVEKTMVDTWNYQYCPDNCVENTYCYKEDCFCAEDYSGDPLTFCEPICDEGNACGNNAYCLSPGVCKCDYGYSGDPYSACDPVCNETKTCIENAKCILPQVCECSPLWNEVGSDPYVECLPVCAAGKACAANAYCDTPGDCLCDVDYEGDPYVGCTPICDPCGTNAHCESPYNCQCDLGFVPAPDPETNCDPNCGGNCADHAICISPPSDCLCEPEYYPFPNANILCLPRCDTPNECVEHAVCVNPNDCQCDPPADWTGDGFVKCDPVCDGLNTCGGNATCKSPDVCECLGGYFGNPLDRCTQNCVPACGLNTDCSPPSTCECKNGYEEGDVHVECFPVCSGVKSCGANATCVAPDVCECLTGWILGDVHVACVPECSGQDACGENAMCMAPKTCQCKENYVGDPKVKCDPTCNPACIANAFCDGVDNCKCDVGYSPNPTPDVDCKPVCTSCGENTECISPETCQCLEGYSGNPLLRCTAVCTTCVENADCTGPEICQCSAGYSPNPDAYTQCDPVCDVQKCKANSHCISPNVCQCDSGYGGDPLVGCLPTCIPPCADLDEYSECVAPNVCECKEGYLGEPCEKTCFPICGKNSMCVAGTSCYCDLGYYWYDINNVTAGCGAVCLNPSCGKNADCVEPDVCECPIGYNGEGSDPIEECFPECVDCDDKNEVCKEPGVCECQEGYEYNKENKCKKVCNPRCHSNAKCLELTDECQCLEGFEGDGLKECKKKLSNTIIFVAAGGGAGVLALLAVCLVIIISIVICICCCIAKKRKGEENDIVMDDTKKSDVYQYDPLQNEFVRSNSQRGDSKKGSSKKGSKKGSRKGSSKGKTKKEDDFSNDLKLRLDSNFVIDFDEVNLEREIGNGGSGAVIFEADWEGRKVAFKIFSTRSFGGNTLEEFNHELKMVMSLSHRDLQHYIEENPETLKFDGKRKILTDVASALSYMHKRDLIHRDMKTKNVLLTDTLVAKVIDFGLSRLDEDVAMTKRVGTSNYMAPEVSLGYDYTRKCDVFSYAIMMWEVFCENFDPYDTTGKEFIVEFRVANDHEFRPKVDEKFMNSINNEKWVADLIQIMWQHEEKDRPNFRMVQECLKSGDISCLNERKIPAKPQSMNPMMMQRNNPLTESEKRSRSYPVEKRKIEM